MSSNSYQSVVRTTPEHKKAQAPSQHMASRTSQEPDPKIGHVAHGLTFTLTRAMPSDEASIEAMFIRCSARSRQYRFFRPLLSAPLGYVEEVLADREKHHAFVVRLNGKTIGFAELHLAGPSSGDLALIVEDPFQQNGVGTAALRLLMRHARELGLRVVAADVQIENARVLNGLRRVAPVSVHRTDDILHVELDLEEAERLSPDLKRRNEGST